MPRVKKHKPLRRVGLCLSQHLVDVRMHYVPILLRGANPLPFGVENDHAIRRFDHRIGPKSENSLSVFAFERMMLGVLKTNRMRWCARYSGMHLRSGQAEQIDRVSGDADSSARILSCGGRSGAFGCRGWFAATDHVSALYQKLILASAKGPA